MLVAIALLEVPYRRQRQKLHGVSNFRHGRPRNVGVLGVVGQIIGSNVRNRLEFYGIGRNRKSDHMILSLKATGNCGDDDIKITMVFSTKIL